MRHKKLLLIGLEFYALLLAFIRMTAGVHTDEAKYLLSIPYPHPPAVRWILGMTSTMPFHEFFWRFIFTSLLAQCVWLILSLARDLSAPARRLVVIFWLFSAAMLLQAGTIMMAPLTAVSGLLFVYVAMRYEGMLSDRRSLLLTGSGTFGLAILWLFSVFTAYQSILFLPLVLACFLRSPVLRRKWLIYLCVPLILLLIYTLSNPLVLASMTIVAGKDHAISLLQKISQFGTGWMLAGSLIFSIFGTIGIFLSRRIELIATFLLLTAYVFFSYQDYYAILFMPLFVWGLIVCFSRMHASSIRVVEYIAWPLVLIIGLIWLAPSFSDQNTARDTAALLQASAADLSADASEKKLLIVGSFGHEWEYYLPFQIVRYSPSLIDKSADVLVCLKQCDELLKKGMSQIGENPPVYIR